MKLEIICYRAGGGESKENTVEAIKNCIRINPNWRIEIDLQLTEDNTIVLLHDYSLKRTHGLDIDIRDIHYDELKKKIVANNLNHIPTLESILTKFPNQKWVFDLHCNNPLIVDQIIPLIEKFKLENRSVIVSEYDINIKRLREKRSNWQHASATKESKKIVLFNKLRISRFFTSSANILGIPYRVGKISILSPRLVRELKNKGKQVWTFGDDLKEIEERRSLNKNIASQMYSLEDLEKLESMGVDAVFTDFPGYINNLLR